MGHMTSLEPPRSLEEQISAWELRPPMSDWAEIANRLSGSAIGRELNRLQGYASSALAERIQKLYARGQIDRSELTAMLRELARREARDGKEIHGGPG